MKEKSGLHARNQRVVKAPHRVRSVIVENLRCPEKRRQDYQSILPNVIIRRTSGLNLQKLSLMAQRLGLRASQNNFAKE